MRYLRRNHRTAAPQSIMAVFPALKRREHNDTPHRYNYYFDGAYARHIRIGTVGSFSHSEKYCATIDDFWGYVASRLDNNRPLWLWSYRAAEDMTALELWQRLIEEEYTLKEPMWRWQWRRANNPDTKRQSGLLVTGDPPTIAVMYHHSGKKLIWCDLRNWLDKPLEEIGDGSSLHDVGGGLGKTLPDTNRGICQRASARILAAVIDLAGFVRNNDMGNFRYTAAGQAMAAYRHRFMRRPILTHTHPQTRKLEREGLHCGQVDCFYVGPVNTCIDANKMRETYVEGEQKSEWCRDIYHVDVNGLYPFAMRENRYPVALVGYSERMSVNRLASVASKFGCMARVAIRSAGEEFPVKHNGQTMACTGSFDTVLCGPELQRAINAGCVHRVYECGLYKMGRIFRRFVDALWALRGKYKSGGNAVYADMCKLIANSLFGKFAQRGAEWIDLPGQSCDEPWGPFFVHNVDTKQTSEFRSVAHHVQLHQRKAELEGTFIAISAYVTAHGREYMRSLRAAVPENSVFYQGVDSLIVNDVAYRRLCDISRIDSDALGMLKIKGMHKSAIIHGVNDYELDGVRCKAGVKYANSPIGSERWQQEEFARMNTQLANKAGPSVYSYERMLESRKSYDRGKVSDDGWVVPWNLG